MKFPGYGEPFNDKLIKDLNNPYRRFFLMEALKIESDEMRLIKLISSLFDHLTNLADALGTTFVNMFSKKKIKTLFPDFRRRMEEEGRQKKKPIFYLPNGKIVEIE